MSEQHPKIYLLPNLMTAGNLFCGFTATLKILEGALLQASNPDAAGDLFHTAIWFILGACFFDLLDGRLARVDAEDAADSVGLLRERPQLLLAHAQLAKPLGNADVGPQFLDGGDRPLGRLDYRIYLSRLWRPSPGAFQLRGGES